MSCYLRHLTDILSEAGIELTKENKKEVDQLIHEVVKIEYKNCPDAWKEVKARIRSDEKERKAFVAALRKRYKG